jgi:hypothetical protein
MDGRRSVQRGHATAPVKSCRPPRLRRAGAGGLAILVVALSGCLWDYTFDGGYRSGVSTVAVPIFDNRSTRVGQELDLTNSVVREIATRTPYRLVSRPDQADLVVRGSIIHFAQPALVQGDVDSVLTGSVMVQLNVQVVDGRTGKSLVTSTRQDWAAFVAARGETIDTARAEVYDRLARWVVQQLEEPW